MSFIKEDFLLRSTAARALYFEYAAEQPIFDYHCHLIPEQIAEDKRFGDITELWLGGDHYKWRLMRLAGVSECDVTGSGSAKSKFINYCRILPEAIGNPVYHWSHLELLRYFAIDEEISPQNAESLWDACNQRIAQPDFSARQLMLRSNVKYVCTSDDPADDLRFHRHLAQDQTFPIGVYPTFRPDKALAIDNVGFSAYIQSLSIAAGSAINNIDALCRVLSGRIAFFHRMGCRMADHGIDIMHYQPATQSQLATIFDKGMQGIPLSEIEVAQYRTEILCELAKEYAQHRWTMQIHIGAMRSVNSRMLANLGRDCGYDSSSDRACLAPLAQLLNRLDHVGALPDTLLFSLDPTLDAALATLAGNFPGDGEVAKVQLGPAWWHNDHKAGMTQQLIAYANAGLLGHFIGMTTDSRSFLSYPRHEYFRRILCNFIGDLVEYHEYPGDLRQAGQLVAKICYANAEERYFRRGSVAATTLSGTEEG